MKLRIKILNFLAVKEVKLIYQQLWNKLHQAFYTHFQNHVHHHNMDLAHHSFDLDIFRLKSILPFLYLLQFLAK